MTPAVTRDLAAFAVDSSFDDLPEAVRTHTVLGFLNWLGCVHGGCREATVAIAADLVAEIGGPAQASVIGRNARTDVASAAFLNCMSSSVQAFDDAHLSTVIHPSGPAAAGAFAFAENSLVSGPEFIQALAIGIELQCRIAEVLVLPPSTFDTGFYVSGLVAPIGVAAAVGRLMGLDARRMAWAIGTAASQASGFRATHGTMTAHFRPAHATRGGVVAAMLAARGFVSADDAIEADKGLIDVFSKGADLARATDRLGDRFELMRNAYKPYPCGIVIHPTIDACLDLREQLGGEAVESVTLRVNPLALKLTGRRVPTTALESHVSIYHWAAAVLLRGRAGLAESGEDCLFDPAVMELRDRIVAEVDPTIGSGEAIVEVASAVGRRLVARCVHARGSVARPMTGDELDAKFTDQTKPVLGPARTAELGTRAREITCMADVGSEIAAIWRG